MFESYHISFFSVEFPVKYLKAHILLVIFPTMSAKKDDYNVKNRLLRIDSRASEGHSLRLYYVRMHEVTDEVKLKIDFGNKIHFIFEHRKQMDRRSSFSPFIYILDLLLQMDNEILYVQHEGRMKPIGEYRLEMLRPSIYGPVDITHTEKGSEGHSLKDCFDGKHCFLFNIRFSSRFTTYAPGKNLQITNGSNK